MSATPFKKIAGSPAVAALPSDSAHPHPARSGLNTEGAEAARPFGNRSPRADSGVPAPRSANPSPASGTVPAGRGGNGRDWHRSVRAQTLVAALDPRDCLPRMVEGLCGRDRMEWLIDEDVERKLIDLRNRAVSSIMGFTFAMAQEFHHADGGKAVKRWLDQADRLPSIDDAVSVRFGEAHAFWSRDRETSRRRWLATLDAEAAA